MSGFWDKLFDYFTHVDDILVAFRQESLDGNAQVIKKLTELVEAATGEVPEEPGDVPRRHLPFYSEATIASLDSVVLLVRADGEQGLGDVGRSGYIVNEGVGNLHLTFDDGFGKSKEIRIDAGETLGIERADDIWIDKLTLRASGGDVDYRCSFSR